MLISSPICDFSAQSGVIFIFFQMNYLTDLSVQMFSHSSFCYSASLLLQSLCERTSHCSTALANIVIGFRHSYLWAIDVNGVNQQKKAVHTLGWYQLIFTRPQSTTESLKSMEGTCIREWPLFTACHTLWFHLISVKNVPQKDMQWSFSDDAIPISVLVVWLVSATNLAIRQGCLEMTITPHKPSQSTPSTLPLELTSGNYCRLIK